jgi:hypothetical protein
MSYTTTITALDFSSGVADVRVTAVYTWTEVGGPTAVERVQDEVTLDLTQLQFLSQGTPATFSYAGDLAPPPSPAWFIGLRIQEVAGVASDRGWLFRSGRFTTEPPAGPIEVILAPEELVGDPELAAAVGTLPTTSGSTTITALTLMVTGSDVALTAVGTDTGLPAGVTFTYTATLVLVESGTLEDVDSPFDVVLQNPSLNFTAGPGTGFVTALLNAMAGIIYNEVAPRVKSTVKGRLNAGILASVATRLNRGVPSTMPPGVVLSIRRVRATTRPTPAGGTESVIGVSAALAAFGGVVNKFPAPPGGGGGGRPCFIATAALSPQAPELDVLRAWRDLRLRNRRGGARLIAAYESVSPPVARVIARSSLGRTLVRTFVIAPSAWLARRSLRQLTSRTGR